MCSTRQPERCPDCGRKRGLAEGLCARGIKLSDAGDDLECYELALPRYRAKFETLETALVVADRMRKAPRLGVNYGEQRILLDYDAARERTRT